MYFVKSFLAKENIPEVVGHDNNTSTEGIDGISQTINGGDIETVGRLVKENHVGCFNGQQGEDDTAALTLGQSAHEGSLRFTSQTVAAKLLAPELVVLGLFAVLVADKVQSRLSQVKLLGTVLRVHAQLQVSVARDGAASGGELASHETQQSRLANTVGTDQGGTGVHVEAKFEVAVQVIGGVARVGKGNIVKGQDWGRQLVNIGEAESKDTVLGNGLDETIGLHLVENLLARLGLTDQVGIGTSTGNELLDVDDFLLLLVVGLHLVRVVFGAGLGVRVVVTTIVLELLLTHVNHVCADTVDKVHGVGNENEGALPLLEILFQPHAGLEIQMGGGVVKQQH